AVTKGYAIASAGLAALVLFGSYVEELKAHFNTSGKTFSFQFSLTEPKVIIGLFIGGLLPFIFTAFSMDAVGKAAGAVVREVRRQIAAKPGILTGQDTPEYGTCVDIVTKAALREMIVPALLPLLTVIAVASLPKLFCATPEDAHVTGALILGGVLVGTIVTGLFQAIGALAGSGFVHRGATRFPGFARRAFAQSGDFLAVERAPVAGLQSGIGQWPNTHADEFFHAVAEEEKHLADLALEPLAQDDLQ